MTKHIDVFVFTGLADWEIGHALAYINQPDFQREPGRFRVRTVGRDLAPVTTLGGLRISPDATLADVGPDTAMFILPGGPAWDAGEQDDVARRAAALVDRGTPVAAICGATAGLARVGLLDARAHTSNAPAYLAATGYAGGSLYRAEPAVVDQHVITAGSVHPVAFASRIFEVLGLYEPAVLAAWSGLFTTGEPRYYDELVRVVGSK